MNAGREIARHRQHSQLQQLEEQGSYAFFNILTGPQPFETVERLPPENHRERLFPPTEKPSMSLTQAVSSDHSCQDVVNRSAVSRCRARPKLCSTSPSGYYRARARLHLTLAQEISIDCARAISDAAPTDWRFRGRPCRLVHADRTTPSRQPTGTNGARSFEKATETISLAAGAATAARDRNRQQGHT